MNKLVEFHLRGFLGVIDTYTCSTPQKSFNTAARKKRILSWIKGFCSSFHGLLGIQFSFLSEKRIRFFNGFQMSNCSVNAINWDISIEIYTSSGDCFSPFRFSSRCSTHSLLMLFIYFDFAFIFILFYVYFQFRAWITFVKKISVHTRLQSDE